MEDGLPEVLPQVRIKPKLALGGVFLRLNRTEPVAAPTGFVLPDSMNPMVIMSGGTVVHRMY